MRPTAKQLLEHKFFKHMPKDRDHLRKRLLNNLPEVKTRVEEMRSGLAGTTPCDVASELEQASTEHYQQGVSQWNFDVQALREQARLLARACTRLPAI